MPNPVPVPSGPLTVVDGDINSAETFVAALARIIQSGATGSTDPSLNPSATLLPVGPDQPPTPVALLTREQQLFYRQLGAAISAVFRTGSAGPGTLPPTQLVPVFVSNGVTKGSGVYIDSAGRVKNGDCTDDTKSSIIGVAAATAGVGAGVAVDVLGAVSGVLTGATTGQAYFLGPTNGQPVLFSSLVPGNRIIQLGVATSPTNLEVQIVDLGVR